MTYLSPSSLNPIVRSTSLQKLVPTRDLFQELHLAEIDCYHKHFQDRLAIGSARIGAPLAWQTNAIGHHIIRRQLRCSKAASDIHAIVMAAQHQILAEEKILN